MEHEQIRRHLTVTDGIRRRRAHLAFLFVSPAVQGRQTAVKTCGWPPSTCAAQRSWNALRSLHVSHFSTMHTFSAIPEISRVALHAFRVEPQLLRERWHIAGACCHLHMEKPSGVCLASKQTIQPLQSSYTYAYIKLRRAARSAPLRNRRCREDCNRRHRKTCSAATVGNQYARERNIACA